MQTKILPCDDKSIEYAAKCINNGDIVAIPTETVYGLAADAFNTSAVKKIFEAKGRPQDNPLIVHISNLSMLNELVTEFSLTAQKVAEKFWPGPLTIIMPKSELVSKTVTAGLDTVAIRFPANKDALKIITASKTPLAAPSANLSGKPSPTTAQHVYEDLNGKIEVILDGGSCSVGLESTVIAVKGNSITVLRPGKITVEDLKTVTDDVTVDRAVIEGAGKDSKVASPGMKYKHYAPTAEVTILDCDIDNFKEYVEKHAEGGTYCLVFDGEQDVLSVPCLNIGKKDDDVKHAQVLFDKLRQLDELGAKKVYARMPSLNGVGLAVYNRLIRAAAFRVIKFI